MNAKNFVVAGIVGFIVDFLLGGLFYGVIFPDIYKTTLNESEHMQFVTLGCLVFGFFVSYVWIKWAGFTNWLSGLKAGAIFGFFYGLSMNMFMASGMGFVMENFIKDMIAGIVMAALVGAAVAFTNGKMK